MKVPAVIVAAALALAGCQGSETTSAPDLQASAGAPDLSDLVGAKGASGETALQSRGFELARTEGLSSYWWNSGTGTCAQAVTADGRYTSVDLVGARECNQPGDVIAMDATKMEGGPPSDIADMVGAKGGMAENGLKTRGYALVRTDGPLAYWWNASSGVCARIRTVDGRYKAINTVQEASCSS